VPAADLDDVAQEVFLRLLRYERAELIEHPQAYLYKMAANVAAEWSIRVRHARPHEAKWLEDLIAEEKAGDLASEHELQDELERALMALTPRQREVLQLQFYESLSRTQIAQRTGLTERTVKRILMKSYAELRRQLNVELLRGISDGH
jgi:RNA polymerase sigma-70 factor (ECF subfamily)